MIPKMTSDGTRLQMIVCSATLHDFDVKKMADRWDKEVIAFTQSFLILYSTD